MTLLGPQTPQDRFAWVDISAGPLVYGPQTCTCEQQQLPAHALHHAAHPSLSVSLFLLQPARDSSRRRTFRRSSATPKSKSPPRQVPTFVSFSFFVFSFRFVYSFEW
jgi:hypothetical protein